MCLRQYSFGYTLARLPAGRIGPTPRPTARGDHRPDPTGAHGGSSASEIERKPPRVMELVAESSAAICPDPEADPARRVALTRTWRVFFRAKLAWRYTTNPI